jgi:tRNA threonylcarbamoyladenosine biosynthesis protein TsaB
MTLILSIETATDVCSVALSENETIIDSKSISEKNVHSAKLAKLIEKLMTSGKKSYADLNAIAMSMGPGSFTGLRIGVSIGKGLAYGLDIPIIGINTLESIAYSASQLDSRPGILWCPVIDARNNEAYYALYDQELNEILPADAGLLNDETFTSQKLTGRIIFVGPAVDSGTIPQILSSETDFAFNIKPDAVSIAKLAYRKYQSQQFEDITFFEPFYLRDFIAKNISSRIKNVLNPENNVTVRQNKK